MLLWLETYLVYPAPRRSSAEWEREDLEFEDVVFHSDDATELHGWFFEHQDPQCHILFCHGNAQQVPDLADWINELRSQYQASVFVFDYRGYGRSQGKPREAGVLADGQAAQRWLAKRCGIEVQQVVLWGLSLGGALAVHCAATLGSRALILDRTFDSIVRVAGSLFPWLPVGWLMKNRFPSSERIARYHGPLLQAHGHNDRIVPFESGKSLFEACPSPDKQFLEFDDFGHLDPPLPEFYAAVHDLLQRVSDPSGQQNNPS